MATEKTKIKIIRPDQIIAKDLTLRESADRLFQVLNSSKENKIIVDFSKIEFISRSFTDEYLNEKQKTKKSITEKNLKTNVKKMFMVVKDSRVNHKHKPQLKEYPRYIFYKIPGL